MATNKSNTKEKNTGSEQNSLCTEPIKISILSLIKVLVGVFDEDVKICKTNDKNVFYIEVDVFDEEDDSENAYCWFNCDEGVVFYASEKVWYILESAREYVEDEQNFSLLVKANQEPPENEADRIAEKLLARYDENDTADNAIIVPVGYNFLGKKAMEA